MAQGKHTGKVIVSFPEPFVAKARRAIGSSLRVKPDGCYLITGAFGGFGKVLAEWLADCGARHLVLTSRNGPATPEAEDFLAKLRGRGVDVQVVLADAGSPEDVKRLLTEISLAGHPLKGVFHLAMVIDDGPLASLNRERAHRGTEGTVHGSCEGTLSMEFELFADVLIGFERFLNSAQGLRRPMLFSIHWLIIASHRLLARDAGVFGGNVAGVWLVPDTGPWRPCHRAKWSYCWNRSSPLAPRGRWLFSGLVKWRQSLRAQEVLCWNILLRKASKGGTSGAKVTGSSRSSRVRRKTAGHQASGANVVGSVLRVNRKPAVTNRSRTGA
jgi:hypothetical protein